METDSVRALIEREIWPYSPGASRSELGLTMRPSGVVPGLVYTWGSYPWACHTCPRPEAVVATRGADVRVLRTPEDWSEIAERWLPEEPGQAITGCTELVATILAQNASHPLIVGPLTGRAEPGNFMVLADTVRELADSASYPPSLSIVMFLSEEGAEVFNRNRSHFTPPQAKSDGRTGWIVSLWGIHELGALRYQCELGKTGRRGQLEAKVQVVDSLGWPYWSDPR